MKLKLIALAAMLAAGSAQARIADSNDYTPNGGDLFANVVSASNNASYTVDLGVSLNEFTAAVGATELGVKLVWDLDNNTFSDLSTTVGGTNQGLAAVMDTLNYGSIYSTFASVAVLGATDLKFDVKAMDGSPTSFAGANTNQYLSTTTAASLAQTNGQVFNMDNWDVILNASNADATNSTHGGIAGALNIAGANMYDAGDAANVNFEAAGDQWNGATSFGSTGAASGSLNFYSLFNSSTNAAIQATVTKYAGVWSFDATTAQLSYATAPVPEAETYAMMLAGLGLVGFMVSRRRKLA